jgi:hypothetical protein
MSLIEMTDRELSLACFALHMFACQAREIADISAQRNYYPAPKDPAPFEADARDSEALLGRLRAARVAATEPNP